MRYVFGMILKRNIYYVPLLSKLIGRRNFSARKDIISGV